MKKLVLLVGFLLFSQSSVAESKVDPFLNFMTSQPERAVSSMKAFGVKAVEGVALTEVLIKTSSVDDLRDAIEPLGGAIHSIVGDIVTATIPLDSISLLKDMDEVIYIEAAKPMLNKMDFARGVTKAQEVQTGSGTTGSISYTGTGAIVGVADTGIDCEHADFKDSNNTTRIIAYWDQTLGTGGVSEITNSSGTEYTGSALNDGGACINSRDSDTTDGHGTHVSGIAAGNNAT